MLVCSVVAIMRFVINWHMQPISVAYITSAIQHLKHIAVAMRNLLLPCFEFPEFEFRISAAARKSFPASSETVLNHCQT